MIAAILNSPKNLTLSKVHIPDPKAGEVRIKITQIGICGSDVHVYLGHRLLHEPTIIGHEGIGIIDKIGANVKNRELGERIVIEPNIPCGHCKYCRSGKGNICINKRIIGINESGCFAEYICLPEAFCWKIDADISNENAVTIEPTVVAYHSLHASAAKPGDTIAVVGLGAIGLLLTHLALSLGYKVYVSELNENKLKAATDMGAIAGNATGNLEQQIETLSNLWLANDVSAVFECAGSAFTASLIAGAAPRGSEIVLVGLSEKEATFKPLKIAREGITIVPSIIYDHPFDFKRVIQLIKSKVINPGQIISKYMPLDQIEEALNLAAQGNDTKIVITV